MPLQSAHVFASHIGHTGKTTLSFQMSCYYATRHPELSVLVMDLAEEGDLSKRFIGGADARERVKDVFGGIFKIISEAGQARSVLTRWLFTDKFDVTEHAVKPATHNPAIPENLYLISSGAWPREDTPMDDETRQRICQRILDSLKSSPTTWKLFCDTDGDRRPSPNTMLGYGLCDQAIVPLHLNKCDLERAETMLGVMDLLRKEGKISTQVLFVVWNFVKSLKDEPCEHRGVTLPFTPTKVCQDILETCNGRLYGMAQELDDLFVHHEASELDFVRSSTCVLRQLADNVLKPSEELGIPFVEMTERLHRSGKKTMKFTSGKVQYDTNETILGSVFDAIQTIETKFEAMSLTGSASTS
mmetsp:Transcript_912/g.1867  ORF Transcript_912/g.1867 Transcript_912/m.1867 type:complete len:358 (-) Transcript_912:105-1178(-)